LAHGQSGSRESRFTRRKLYVGRRKLAEGVGFEPTVPLCGTLDFESSALNRTQPPFLKFAGKLRTLNVQHPTPNAKCILTFGVERSAFDVAFPVLRTLKSILAKKCYNLVLDLPPVCTAYCVLAGWRPQHLVISGHWQLLTGYW
jgi:hypothetical protein